MIIAEHDLDTKLASWMIISSHTACIAELCIAAGIASRLSACGAVLGLLECKAGRDWDGHPALGK